MTEGIHRSQHKFMLTTARTFFVPRVGVLCQRTIALCLCVALILSSTACSLGKPSNRGKAPPPGAAQKAQAAKGPTAMDTFRALAKPEGLKFTPLFTEPLDDDARFRRLETSVQDLRNDLDTVVPSMVRLVAIEKDMKELVAQLKTLTGEAPPMDAVEMLPVEEADITNTNTNSEIPGEDVVRGTEPANQAVDQAAEAGDKTTSTSSVTPEAAPQGMPPEGAASPNSKAAENAAGPALPVPPPVPPSRLPEPPPAPETKPAPAAEKPAAPVSGEARDFRIGDHPDKTRLVFDLSEAAALSAVLANDGTQVVIDLHGMKWAAKDSSGGNVAALIAGWAVVDGKVVIDLLGPATIKKQEVLAPQGGAGNYRLIIDLHSEALHSQ